ncbi:hypothetical protein POM88_015305 [Heracleum sosnowskyi]|uniref:Uncharacterized protein n=1 Tax=Heracleum sosnowskyi TaxID=360622 RepID=A0AAD8IJX9_9APIA|nr:hypothetical protein POM88_015305 [Heracleum sosnowskyi]
MNNCRVWRRYTVPEPKKKGVIKRLVEGAGPIMLVNGLLGVKDRVVSTFSDKPNVEEKISGLEKKISGLEKKISGLEKKVEEGNTKLQNGIDEVLQRVPAKVVGHCDSVSFGLYAFIRHVLSNQYHRASVSELRMCVLDNKCVFENESDRCLVDRGTNSLLFAHMLLGLGNAKNISFDLDSIEYWDHSEDLDNYMRYGLYFTIGAAGVRAGITRCR